MTKLPPELLRGLKDWSVGITPESVADELGEAGPYFALLTFDDNETATHWTRVMTAMWQKG